MFANLAMNLITSLECFPASSQTSAADNAQKLVDLLGKEAESFPVGEGQLPVVAGIPECSGDAGYCG